MEAGDKGLVIIGLISAVGAYLWLRHKNASTATTGTTGDGTSGGVSPLITTDATGQNVNIVSPSGIYGNGGVGTTWVNGKEQTSTGQQYGVPVTEG